MAEVFEVLGESDRATALRQQAGDLRQRFAAAFWDEDEGTYCFGLDGQKRRIRSVVSNVGHCLWSGIASEQHAERVVRRLMSEDMWSGWGIRTLSARHLAYNLYSYHCGSIWPHDNGILAAGFKRYGFADEANRLARDIWEAASCFEAYRLPEHMLACDAGGAVSQCSIRAPTSPKPGRLGRSSMYYGPSWDYAPTRQRDDCMSPRHCQLGYRI